jgi:SAM-dependent methyltransferase
MTRLTERDYWDGSGYRTASGLARLWLPASFASVHYQTLLRRYLRPGMRVIEIGVAPGLDLIDAARRLRIDPYGVDYSEPGIRATRRNFARAGFDERRIVHADLFAADFQEANRKRYDAVLSAGFVEHFSDPAEAVANHLTLLKPGGVAVISVPNLWYIARFLPEDIRAIHNMHIMRPHALSATLGDAQVLAHGYFGGWFNLGLVFSRRPAVEALRRVAYLGQRLTIDQLQRLLLRLGIELTSPRFTPGIYVVARVPGDSATPA